MDEVKSMVDGMTATVDGAVKVAIETKEDVKKVEAAVEAIQGDIDKDR